MTWNSSLFLVCFQFTGRLGRLHKPDSFLPDCRLFWVEIDPSCQLPVHRSGTFGDILCIKLPHIFTISRTIMWSNYLRINKKYSFHLGWHGFFIVPELGGASCLCSLLLGCQVPLAGKPYPTPTGLRRGRLVGVFLLPRCSYKLTHPSGLQCTPVASHPSPPAPRFMLKPPFWKCWQVAFA